MSMRPRLDSRRYRYHGRPLIRLSATQRDARKRVEEKLLQGIYRRTQVRCPLCDSIPEGHLVLAQTDMYGLPVTTVLCPNCGLLFSNPMPSADALGSFYDDEYRQLDRGNELCQDEFFQMEVLKGERIYLFLKEQGLLPELKDRHVVEVGCGAGGILHYFKSKGYQVAGCDMGGKYLEYGNREGLGLVCGTVRDLLPLVPKASVGLLIYEQAFEHMREPKTELEDISRLLGDGLLYVAVPGLRNIPQHYRHDFLHYLQFPHLLHFELSTLKRLFASGGYTCVCGDETIRAVFRRGGAPGAAGNNDVSPPLDPLHYLRNLERARRMATLFGFPRKAARFLIEKLC